MKSFAIVFLSVTLCSCAGFKDGWNESMRDIRVAIGTGQGEPQGQAFVSKERPSANGALVYVYRNSGYAYAPDILINGKNLSLLGDGGFLVEPVDPGRVSIRVQKNPNAGNWNFDPIGLDLNVRQEEVVFVRIGAGIGGVIITPLFGSYSYQTEISTVPESIAIGELTKLRRMR
jgi:hypothetical protein